ncbi:MAG: MazG family protein [Verrucomicrobia bacterium]|nr:MazG family protein [Verrucomicrobiota bacterium]
MENKNDLQDIENLLRIMARLRSPDGCPWDREQNHQTIAPDLLEESAELLEAIETHDDEGMLEELGDLLLQIVFHSQLARERNAFDFHDVVRVLSEKLIRRHPHVFGNSNAKDIDVIWEQWERIKKEEKSGTDHERKSALDGIPPTLTALMSAQKLFKKANKAKLLDPEEIPSANAMTQEQMTDELCRIARIAQLNGWDAESLLRNETRRLEEDYRRREASGRK